MSFRSIAIIGFGEVGQVLADDLAAAGISDIRAFDILFTDDKSIPSRGVAARKVLRAKTAGEAVTGAELVISAVTAASDAAAAESVAPSIKKNAFFLDLNSVSPSMKQHGFDVVSKGGGRYVESAVMTPIHPRRIASPMLLAGPHAREFHEQATPLGFKLTVFSEKIGQASAAKMCRSVVIKGLESLLTESMLSARQYGVEADVLASLSDMLPVGDWPKLARYMISRSLEHGTRRAEEMREVGRTVSDVGIKPLMSLASAERQDISAAWKSALGGEEQTLEQLLDAVLVQSGRKKDTRA